MGLWRTIINGYPYKSLEELGVADIDEAFTATKHAIYCYLFENTPDDYEGIGEAGERTLNALKNIVENAQNSTETQITNAFTIEAESDEWLEDAEDNNYISKIFSINSNLNNLEYRITIEGDLSKNTKLVKVDDTNKKKFKIMLFKEEMEQKGNIIINVEAKIKTKPVIYGGAPDASLQNYALTAYMYEDFTNTYEDTYIKPEEPQLPEEPEQPKENKIYEEQTKIEEIVKEPKILPVTGI